MKNFILISIVSIITHFFYLVSVHDHEKNSYEFTGLICFLSLALSLLVFFLINVRSINVICVFFIGFFITFLLKFNPIYLSILDAKFTAIDSAFIIDKKDNLNFQKVNGNFHYGYIYEVDLLNNEEFRNASVESNNFLYWETAYLSGYKPQLLDVYDEDLTFLDKIKSFFMVYFYSLVELFLKSIFSNIPILMIVSFLLKRRTGFDFYDYKF